jgi:hypothetical protein
MEQDTPKNRDVGTEYLIKAQPNHKRVLRLCVLIGVKCMDSIVRQNRDVNTVLFNSSG